MHRVSVTGDHGIVRQEFFMQEQVKKLQTFSLIIAILYHSIVIKHELL